MFYFISKAFSALANVSRCPDDYLLETGAQNALSWCGMADCGTKGEAWRPIMSAGYHPQLPQARKHRRLNAFFSQIQRRRAAILGCHAVWKYPHMQLKSRADPVGFRDLLIISIYSHSAFCGHTYRHLMMPHLAMEIGVLSLHLHEDGSL